MVTIEKSAAAIQLLERAIIMYFDGEPLYFVVNLAQPAHLILKDMAQRAMPDTYFSSVVHRDIKEHGADVAHGVPLDGIKDFFNVLHAPANSAKHFQNPDERVVTIEADDIHATFTQAIGHALDLGISTNILTAFGMWLVVARGLEGSKVLPQAREIFPGFEGMTEAEKLEAGRRLIQTVVQTGEVPLPQFAKR
ncbi:hypothetical protein B0E47_00035 [Rhodanobacter sp. B05]|uniref:hypothetical protein n=1 Tax=Rhodanobacter sp. B05 TaxID=1945859 RepID=UPI0009876107|nr:hypothetical protein [Rhodanobacter sp. B05]OOG61105.1 hypothetical protein B0E47_00035 [Rhodanobacter sp. B05]